LCYGPEGKNSNKARLTLILINPDIGKLAEELVSNPELRGVVETLCVNLRKGRRLKNQ